MSYAHADKASKANNKGIETYKNGDYQESVRHFTEALVERPDSPILRFNRGTALAAENNHEEAASELLSAANAMKTPEGSAAAIYNAANSLAAGSSLEDAVTLYKQGIKLDQQSEDIRHNLELVMRKMQNKDQQDKQQQDQQDQQKKDQDSQDKDKNDKQDDKDKKQQDQQQQDQKNKTNQQNKDKQQDQQQQESQQEQNEKQPMSPEEAKRLLDALNDEEKKSLSMRYQKMTREMRQGDDW